MSYTKENFEKWNKLKQSLQFNIHNSVNCKEGDIWFGYLGLNLGDEEFGKGDMFLRPIYILKKYSMKMLLGIPLTTNIKRGKYSLVLKLGTRESKLLFSQVKCISYKRLAYRSSVVGIEVRKMIYKKFVEHLK